MVCDEPSTLISVELILQRWILLSSRTKEISEPLRIVVDIVESDREFVPII
jgi:hypothetical protein